MKAGRRLGPVVLLTIFALVMAQRGAPHMRAVDFVLVFGSERSSA